MRNIFHFFLTAVWILEVLPARSQPYQVDHWETIVQSQQIWHYFPGTSEPATNWNDITFDDNSWATGGGGIGYGDGDDSTLIDPVISVYLRRKFNILDTANIGAMMFYMDYDDAFVAYINGVEIARANVMGSPPSYHTEATTYREATMYSGGIPEEFQVPLSVVNTTIIEGENVLAIQVHNHGIGSSDMSAIPFLIAGINDTTISYQALPEWFVSPLDYYSSHLPIISINTFGNMIVDEPRIRAEMGVIDKGPGNINHLSDTFNGYHGWINIELRGESAQMFPKKSYGFETQDSLGQNLNVQLLGLPEENDWILYGPYSDKTLIKNVLSLKLFRDMGRYASRTKYCELFINGSYQGLYVLMEKIKQDKNRVNISKLNPEDTEGDQLTGGYILRVDKIDDNDYPPFVAYPEVSIPEASPVTLQWYDPGGEELNFKQRNYIQDYIRRFELALNSSTYLSYFTGYHEFIDKDALIDYLIIHEISKNIDAYIFSTYMYKDRDSKGGRLTMGPAWDFNIAYGNVDYHYFATLTSGWMYSEDYRMYWFRRMMTDPALQNKMSCRWHELRMDILSNQKIFGYIDSLVTDLQDPIQDNFRRWPVLGEYVWPNSFIGTTYEEEITFLKNWLNDRLRWMDENINESCIEAINEQVAWDYQVNLYPNPFDKNLIVEVENPESWIKNLAIYDIAGAVIWNELPKKGCRNFIWNGRNSYGITVSKGLYIIQVELNDGYKIVKKILKE